METAWCIGIDGRRLPLTWTTNAMLRPEFNVQRLAPGAYVLVLTDRSGSRLSARFTKE